MTQETMTKKKLLAFLEEFPDDATIGAWWDDCEWEITGIISGDKAEDYDILISCP